MWSNLRLNPPDVVVTEGLGNHQQGLAERQRAGNEGMSDVMDAHVVEFGPRADAQEDRPFLPTRVRVGEDGRQERVRSDKRCGLAFDRHLRILVEVTPVDLDARVEDRVQPVAFGPFEVAPHEGVDLLGGVDLGSVEFRLQVVELIGVVRDGFGGMENARPATRRGASRRGSC